MPQKPFSIMPKQEEKEPAWVNVALVVGGLLLVVVLVPLFLSRGKVGKLEEKKQALTDQITGLIAENQAKARELSKIADRVNDFSSLFREHRITSSLFAFLGSVCHPLVQFTSFDFSDENFRITLGVRTENFKTLGEQLLIFKQNENITEPKISSINLDRDGFVNAKFDFGLNKKLIMPFSL